MTQNTSGNLLGPGQDCEEASKANSWFPFRHHCFWLAAGAMWWPLLKQGQPSETSCVPGHLWQHLAWTWKQKKLDFQKPEVACKAHKHFRAVAFSNTDTRGQSGISVPNFLGKPDSQKQTWTPWNVWSWENGIGLSSSFRLRPESGGTWVPSEQKIQSIKRNHEKNERTCMHDLWWTCPGMRDHAWNLNLQCVDREMQHSFFSSTSVCCSRQTSKQRCC